MESVAFNIDTPGGTQFAGKDTQFLRVDLGNAKRRLISHVCLFMVKFCLDLTGAY